MLPDLINSFYWMGIHYRGVMVNYSFGDLDSTLRPRPGLNLQFYLHFVLLPLNYDEGLFSHMVFHFHVKRGEIIEIQLNHQTVV